VSDKNAPQLIHRHRFERSGRFTMPQARLRIHAPISRANDGGARIKQEDGRAMTEKEKRLARDRAEIAARVARFRETQQKFEREREEYYETTLANAVNGTSRPSFWR
jgi:hypothetical protein